MFTIYFYVLISITGWLSKVYDSKDVTDPFVDVRLGKAKLVKSTIIQNNLNPVWNESYKIDVCHYGDQLLFEIRDKDHAMTEYIGSVEIDTMKLIHGEIFSGKYPILKRNKKPNGTLNIYVEFR